jgi:flagellar secretion chaperone FliS
VGQVVALYDAILRDLHRAAAAMGDGQIEARVNASNHALMIVGELQGVLDYERGGEVAEHLNNFYNVTRVMITVGSITSSAKKIREVIAMFTRLRSAWSQVERTVKPSEPKERIRISSRQQPAFSEAVTISSNKSTESGNGGWRA